MTPHPAPRSPLAFLPAPLCGSLNPSNSLFRGAKLNPWVRGATLSTDVAVVLRKCSGNLPFNFSGLREIATVLRFFRYLPRMCAPTRARAHEICVLHRSSVVVLTYHIDIYRLFTTTLTATSAEMNVAPLRFLAKPLKSLKYRWIIQ